MMTTRKAARRNGDEWVTLQAAATALGESRLAVLTRIVKGELDGAHVAKRTVVKRVSLAALIATLAEDAEASVA